MVQLGSREELHQTHRLSEATSETLASYFQEHAILRLSQVEAGEITLKMASECIDAYFEGIVRYSDSCGKYAKLTRWIKPGLL